jgi:hypothetical protein
MKKQQVEPIPYALFTPAEIASPEVAVDCLYRQFVKLMTLVYNGWNEYEPEYSEQELQEDLRLWRENYKIATVRWKESDVFYRGLRTLIEQVRTWQPEDMPNPAKVGMVTKEQMTLLTFLQEEVGAHQPAGTLITAGRLEWEGDTISFVEIFDGLVRRGYLSYPEGNQEEFVRRLQQVFLVLKNSREEMRTATLANRFRGKRNVVLRERMNALPEARKKKPKGE